MALKLPPEGHPVRSLFKPSDVPTTATAYRLLPSLQQARHDAREAFKADRARPGFSVTGRTLHLYHTLVAHSDGRVLLMCFGPKGGFRTRWNFGRWSSEPEYRCKWPNCSCDPTKLSGMSAKPCASNDAKCKNVT